MRVGILIVVSMLTNLYCSAQQAAPTMLDSVEVYGIPDEGFLVGAAFTTVDSAMLRQQRSRHLGDVLATQLPVYFRNYGQGMISGISLRGTSPQHTAVLWNGININSFSLGQADFSILPASAFGSIKVHAGGGSARYGSGALGGTVLLTSPETPTNEILHVTQEMGSFGQYFAEGGGAYALGRWDFHTQLYHAKSDNDFKILTTGERQQHAAYHQSGVLQDVAYHLSASQTLALHYWYHDSFREVQPPIGQYNGRDEQDDQNHRLNIQYKSGTHRGTFTATGGYVRDGIIFRSGPMRSESVVTRWIGALKQAWTLLSDFHVEAGAEWNHIRGAIEGYPNDLAIEDRFDFMVSMQKNMGRRLSLALNLRQPAVSGFSPPFLPYLGIEYHVVKRPNAMFTLKGNASRNYRVPTLNDRYWKEVGNPHLQPELSYAAEAGWQWTWHGLTVDNTWYQQEVDQWIQWAPDDRGVYVPANIKHVRVRGVELRATLKEHLGLFDFTASAGYQYTRSITTEAPPLEPQSLGKQLIYTPEHTASGYLRTDWRNYSVTVQTQYVSKRYTGFDNASDFTLDPYARVDLTLGRAWQVTRHAGSVQVAIVNILNEEYEQYSARAMPGRYYNVQLIYQLNTIKK
jgi:vitamin B12 transporter